MVTVTMLQAKRSGVRIPVERRDFYLLHIIQTDSGAHPDSYSMDKGFLSGDIADAALR
jgi:hypothetical protein